MLLFLDNQQWVSFTIYTKKLMGRNLEGKALKGDFHMAFKKYLRRNNTFSTDFVTFQVIKQYPE